MSNHDFIEDFSNGETTIIFLLIGMFSLHMLVQVMCLHVAFSIEPSATNLAVKGSFTCVNLQVCLQVIFSCEAFATHLAIE